MICFRTVAVRRILHELDTECSSLCSLKRPSLLREVTPDNLLATDLGDIINEWRDRTEIFYPTLASICKHPVEQNRNEALAASGSILLKERNKKMSRLHHCVGLFLDHGGAKNKAISAIQTCGASVAYTTINEKKKKLKHGMMTR